MAAGREGGGEPGLPLGSNAITGDEYLTVELAAVLVSAVWLDDEYN
jgi:hypothetical protein